ncbi:MAG: hypothetical protein KC636_28170, partial [Myxococcales bacterium]|nr:hypothetical protein [Myxococcales bacterium]
MRRPPQRPRWPWIVAILGIGAVVWLAAWLLPAAGDDPRARARARVLAGSAHELALADEALAELAEGPGEPACVAAARGLVRARLALAHGQAPEV